MPEKCPICGERKSENSPYCENHQLAYENLKKQYQYWREALQIDWQEYLQRIVENKNTGQWAKEVAKDLIEKQKTKNY